MKMSSGKTEKLAAIDIGTNSTRLLAVNVQVLELKKILYPAISRQMQITRLGKNTDSTGIILPESSEKTINVLEGYIKFIKEIGVDRCRAVGTRVLRKASNSGDFIKQAEKRTGIKVEIISGNEEAALSFRGAVGIFSEKVHTLTSGEKILVIDVGGGSTELILGSPDGKIEQMESINIGSVVLSERFLNHKKPSEKEILELEDFAEKKLLSVSSIIKETAYSSVIGLAGTISALASIDLCLKNYDRDKIHGHYLSLDKIKRLYKMLRCTDLKERKTITGLEPARADIILGGAAVTVKLLELLGAHGVIVSESDILEGIIYSIF